MDCIAAAVGIGWLTATEAAALLGKAPSTIRRWKYQALLAGRRCADGRIRYDIHQLWDVERDIRLRRDRNHANI